jgi:hypothetical protein
MLTPIDGQELPTTKFSKKSILCKCSCGNPDTLNVRWSTFSREKPPTCGKCAVMRWRSFGVTKYGRLTLDCPLETINAVRQVVPWKCDCGGSKDIALFRVISGNTKSCGCAYNDPNPHAGPKHPKISKAEWLKTFPALIDKNLPDSWSKKAGTKCEFLCECSKVFTDRFNNYKLGKRCGHCNDIILNKGDKINGFIYDGNELTINPKSLKKIELTCKNCGHTDDFIIKCLYDGQYARCSFCNKITAEDLKDKKFGRLTIKDPKDTTKYSTKKVIWLCDCGNEHLSTVSNVVNGVAKSCGNCHKNIDKWFNDNKEVISALKCPITINDIPSGGIKPLEIIKNTKDPFLAECVVCKREYKPRWEGVRLGVSLTCGCTTNRVSSGQNEVCDFIKSLGVEAILEHGVNNLKYDVYVPSNKLLIEYNGLNWHSEKYSCRDVAKYDNAVNNGYSFLSIFEDEWIYKQEVVKNLIRGNTPCSNTIYGSDVNVKPIDNSEANSFYEQFHHLGSCQSETSYGAFCRNNPIAYVSFEQTDNQWGITRMAINAKYRVYGVWSKLLRLFVDKHQPASIVSFSDNRLFSGGVYEQIGFKFDGDVEPDYYWCKGQQRFHKSSLRKEGEKTCVLTETKLREAEGYSKIWDLGKKRWIYLES